MPNPSLILHLLDVGERTASGLPILRGYATAAAALVVRMARLDTHKTVRGLGVLSLDGVSRPDPEPPTQGAPVPVPPTTPTPPAPPASARALAPHVAHMAQEAPQEVPA